MISFFKTVNGRIAPIDTYESGCWINVVSPTESEMSLLTDELKIDGGFIKSGLDEEEVSRIESDEGQTLIIFDIPIAQSSQTGNTTYSTLPMGVIIAHDFFITVASREHALIKEFSDGIVKNVETSRQMHFLLMLLLKASGKYLAYLRQIDKLSTYVEKQLYKAMKNKELIQLLEMVKSLVYFSTSLKAVEVTLNKIQRSRYIPLDEEDADLLEDVIVEIKQAIEMATIYSGILSGTMDAFASVISNNLNIVMRVLASITIIMAVPTIVFSFYGMNTPLPLQGSPILGLWYVPLGIAIIATVICAIVLKKKNMF
ncbi:MAG: magnesium transporter CorA family protein [Ruminococcaceae bacterium]|nr:magnesium transporter CorA family protein [Oscillospiraceae bacterium]